MSESNLKEENNAAIDNTRQKAKTKKKKAEAKRQKAEGRGQKAEAGNSSSLIPHPSSLIPHFLPIGKIVAAQGMKGEVRVYPESDFPERFLEPGTRWLLRSHASQPEPIQLVRGRYLDGKGLYVVQFADITDRTQAEALRDCQLLVPASDRPPLEAGEFHILDLIGLKVFDQATQTPIGTVISIIQAGNDLLEVQRDLADGKHGQTVLIPFVEAIVPVVDLSQRRIEITPPLGLIASL